MADTDREVFQYFRRDPNRSAEIDALAYASFAFDKYEWMTKYEQVNGTPPSPEQIDRWIKELPDSRLDDIQQSALEFFGTTIDAYVRDASSKAYQTGKQDAIVAQVTRATSFWRNLPGNIAVGVASSFAFAVLLIAASIVLNKDPSPIALYQKLATPAEPPSPPPK